MLDIFWEEYGLILLVIVGCVVVGLAARARNAQLEAQRLQAEAADKVRATLAQAADQGQLIDFTLPQWDDEEIHLGQARYMGSHPEGMRLELWARPGTPVLNHEQVRGYFRLKHMGPVSHYDFRSSMHEYCRDGNRVEVIVPWPTELGHGERRFFAAEVENTGPEPGLRLWRASQGPEELSPQCWEALAEHTTIITDMSGQHLSLGLENRESMYLREGSLLLCRMTLPYVDADTLELMLAGTVQSIRRQPDMSHDALVIGWQRWALPGESENMEWHKVEPGQSVPLLQNWVGLRRQME